MTGNNNVVRLHPKAPLQADEFWEGDTNSVDTDDGTIVVSAGDIQAINEVEDDARTHLIAIQVTNMIGQLLEASGYDNPIETDADIDLCLVTESVTSLLHKYAGKHHPLQDLAERTITVEDEEFLSYDFNYDLEITPVLPEEE